MENIRVRNLFGESSAWTSNDLVLGRGEIAIELLPSGHMIPVIGNGTDKHNFLPPMVTQTVSLEYLQFLNKATSGTVPKNAFFIDSTDSVLKFKDDAGLVRIVNLT